MSPLFATTLLSATVVVTCGVLFLLETLLRRDTGAGRIWSLAFLSGILTVLCYLLWAIAPVGQAWFAVAFGNAAVVATIGFLWLGCRSFNRRSLSWGLIVIAAGCLATMIAALLPGPDGGDWAGAATMFLGVTAFAIAGAIETRRGALGATVISLGLTAVLTITAMYYLGRTVVFLTLGPYSDLFITYFGNLTTAILTIVLTIIAMLTGSILRGQDNGPRRGDDPFAVAPAGAGVLTAAAFDSAMGSIIERSRANADLVALVALRMDDLPQLGMAFGSSAQAELAAEWRRGVRAFAPSFAIVAEGGPTSLVVAFQPESAGNARRVASRIHRRVVDGYTANPDTPTPVMGVGVALSDAFGYDIGALRRAADDAAFVSASSPDASVIVAGLA